MNHCAYTRRSSGGFGRSELLLLIGSICFTLLIAEGIARWQNLAPTIYQIQPGREKTSYKISDNPILGYELKNNYRDIRPDHWESFERINQHGLRDVDREIAKPPGTQRVILLGDSVVLGIALTDISYTISRQLELMYSSGVEVLNFGLAGYNTLQEAELLRVKGIQFSPDVVVVLFTENDFHDKSGNIWAYSFNRPPGINALFTSSDLFRWLALKFDWFHFRSELDPNYQQEWNYQAIGENNVLAGLRLLAKLRRENGFKLLLAAWPQFTDTGPNYPDYLMDQAEPQKLKIEALAEKFDIPVVRLDAAIQQEVEAMKSEDPALTSGGTKTTFTTDGMHPNNNGTKAAARALKKVLAEKELVAADS
ncbi:MAG: SGNH/GDSL hydrolase family protein [Bdellovibrionales bacterium]|nr:SGNH/GDSL hydrolase family protein [Bdellovibrionales bacterium]